VALRSVPVVVLSVDDRTADIAACMELGAKDYFIKPIRMDMAPSLLKFARDRCVLAFITAVFMRMNTTDLSTFCI
jgi:DNA-binding response OmpR family regulator